MTTTATDPQPHNPTAASALTPVSPPPRTGNPWRPTFRGVGLVTQIELLRRRPSTKGYIAYATLFALIVAMAVLAAVNSGEGLDSILLELVLVLVLGAGLLVAPSLSATSLNGDSSEGVLAPLQMSHLTAGDIAVGKLLASWIFAIAVLVTTTPLLWFAYTRSGWHLDELAIVVGVILFTVLVFTAVGLAWSAIAARAVASVSLAHLTTGLLALGTLLLFAFTMPLVSEESTGSYTYVDWENLTEEQAEAVDNAYMTGDPLDVEGLGIPCATDEFPTTIVHTDRTAWLLLINPVVVIGESSPIVDPVTYEEDGRAAPGLFAEMHRAVSDARMGPPDESEVIEGNECEALATGDAGSSEAWAEQQQAAANHPRAPWLGLAVQAALLVGSMWMVVRRLRVPYKKLRSGTRVA